MVRKEIQDIAQDIVKKMSEYSTSEYVERHVLDEIAAKQNTRYVGICKSDIPQESKVRAVLFKMISSLREDGIHLLNRLAKYESAGYKNVNHPNPDDFGFWGINLKALKDQYDQLAKTQGNGRLYHSYYETVCALRDVIRPCECRNDFESYIREQNTAKSQRCELCITPDQYEKQISGIALAIAYRYWRLVSNAEKKGLFEKLCVSLDTTPRYHEWLILNSWTDMYAVIYPPDRILYESVTPKVSWLEYLQRTKGVNTEATRKYKVTWRDIE